MVKRAIKIATVLCLFSATFAFATPRYPGYGHVVAPPGNTTFARPVVRSTWYIGPFGLYSTSDWWRSIGDGCEEHVVSRTDYRFSFGGIVGDTIEMIVGKRCGQ